MGIGVLSLARGLPRRKCDSKSRECALHSLPRVRLLSWISIGKRRCRQNVYWTYAKLQSHSSGTPFGFVETASPGDSTNSYILSIPGRFDDIFKRVVFACPCCLPIEFNEFVGLDGRSFKNRTLPCEIRPGR